MAPQRYWGHDIDPLGSRDVIDHVTIGLGVGTFLLVVNDDHVPILHGYGDTGLRRFWSSIGTISLSCTVMKIFGPKDKEVTSLTFWGHVTSLIT